MPFTLAHPIFAAPVKWIKPEYISLTGLVLGAMAPDYEYFIMLEPHQWIGHSLMGLLLEAIPLCIILAYMFHLVVKKPLARHLPAWFGLDQRAIDLVEKHRWQLRSLRQWFVFIVSVIVGFYTHILVDGFTHEHGAFVQLIPSLQESLIGTLPNYKLMQYGSSLIGMGIEALILLYILHRARSPLQRQRSVPRKNKLRYWGVAASIMLIIWVLKLLSMSGGNYIGASVVTPISGMCVGIVISSLIYRNESIAS